MGSVSSLPAANLSDAAASSTTTTVSSFWPHSRLTLVAFLAFVFLLIFVVYYWYHKTVKQQKIINMLTETNEKMATEMLHQGAPHFVNPSRLKGNRLNPWTRKPDSPSDRVTIETEIHPRPKASAARKAPKAPPPAVHDVDEDDEDKDDEEEDEAKEKVTVSDETEVFVRPPRKTAVIKF